MFFIIQAARIDMLALVCAFPRCGHVVLLSEHPTTTTASIKISIYIHSKLNLNYIYSTATRTHEWSVAWYSFQDTGHQDE